MNTKAAELDVKLDRLEERFVFEEISKVQYDKFKSKLESEKNKITELVSNSGFNSSNLKNSIDKALNFALNLPSLWQSGNIEVKRSLQFMLFPEGIGYDFKNDRLRTFRVNSIFSAIASISDKLGANKNGIFQNNFEKSRLVTSTGFKPVTS